jgi:phospholipid/cholesterol/gamma-HCH transport system substrate-binding protein
MKEERLELKVGLTLVVAITIFAGFLLTIKQWKWTSGGQRVSVVFDYISGLSLKSPVRLSGVKIGEVESIGFIEEEGKIKVKVNLRLKEGVSLRKDAQVYIHSLGLLGEKYIEIFPGSPRSAFLEEGEVLEGTEATSIEALSFEVKRVSQKIEKAVVDFCNFLGADGNEKGLFSTLATLNSILKEFEALLSENRNELRSIIKNITRVSQELNKAVVTFNKTLKTINKTVLTAQEIIEDASQEIKEVTGEKEQIKKALRDLSRIAARVAKLSQSLEEGPVGKLITDPEIYHSLKETLKNFKELSQELKKRPWRLLKKR